MGNTRSLTDKPIQKEVIEEDGKTVAAHLSDVVTDPESADAVQIPDPNEFPSANATEQDPLAVNSRTSPADGLDPDNASVNEVQRIDPTGTVSGGTYDFTLPAETGGDTVSDVPYDATPTEVQDLVDAALGSQATDDEDNANVTVSGAAVGSGNLDFTFSHDFGAQDLSAMTVDDASITGGGSLAVVEVTKGVHADA